jgi:hypothetical protein
MCYEGCVKSPHTTALHQTMQNACNPLFPGRQVRLASTAKPITPFGGLVSFITFLERIGLAGKSAA